MKKTIFSQFKENPLFFVFLGVIFILAGIIIASNLNLSPHSKAVDISQPRSGSSLRETGESPFVWVAEKVSPTVVNISAEVYKKSPAEFFFPFDDPFFRRFFGEAPEEKAPPRKYKTTSLGSGFIFKKEGYILTNNHVVSGAEKIWVKLPDGSEYKAKLLGADDQTDIAVLKIDAERDLPVAELGDSDSIRVGDWAIAIGNPFPQLGLDRTLTVGVVSGVGRRNLTFGEGTTPAYQNYIQTDASINPGNSGGPLVNTAGKVIGINAAITNPTGMAVNIGIGFAIPINLAKSVIPYLVEGKEVSRGYLGIMLGGITKDLKEALDLPTDQGVIVNNVQENTPAFEAGIKRGDVIVKFNGKDIKDVQQFMLLVAQSPPHSKVELEVIRKGKRLNISVKLGSKSEFVSSEEKEKETKTKTGRWMGLEVETATKELADQYKVKFTSGVLVVDVEQGSSADEKEIHPGDIIIEIDQREVTNLADYEKIVSSLKDRQKAIPLVISRNGNIIYLAIKP